VSRHPVLTWTLRALRAAQLALLFLFVAYFVSVQVNAIAYLAGRKHPLVPGTVPSVPLDSAIATAADITAGLIVESAIAVIVSIMTVLFRAAMWRRRRVFHHT
jgi:hypothetical protein